MTQTLTCPVDEAQQETKKPSDAIPEQGSLLGKIVDVNTKDGQRLGCGKILRDDMDAPYILRVKMLCPPFVKGKILENPEDQVRVSLCPSQAFLLKEEENDRKGTT